jgi:ADP-ribose pyrophosphatase
LANIICDERENIWAIDWTYTDLHPIEVDLTKLENDVKFVISKQFEAEDFSKIQLLEDYLLSTPIPQAINELPAGLKFIEWDLRFKKILLTVKIIREVYFSLKDDSDWIVYQIGLLRYAVHTLSFDMNREQGECSPIQLWAALYSVEQLLFQLVSDDFHLKIRGERPATYPQRFRITIDQASWNIPSPEYNPPYYVDTTVLENDYKKIANGWADSEEDWKLPQDDGSEDNIDRDEEGKPINPKGRTGIAGRGLFGKWGPNPYVILLISRVNKNSGDTEILLQIDSSDDVLLPEKFIKRIETLESTKKNLLGEFFLTENRIINSKLIHEGYLYDRRQTDNAWLNANCYILLVDESEMESDTTIASKFKWEIVSTELINQLPASRAELIRIAIDHLSKDGLIDITSAQEILKETG